MAHASTHLSDGDELHGDAELFTIQETARRIVGELPQCREGRLGQARTGEERHCLAAADFSVAIDVGDAEPLGGDAHGARLCASGVTTTRCCCSFCPQRDGNTFVVFRRYKTSNSLLLLPSSGFRHRARDSNLTRQGPTPMTTTPTTCGRQPWGRRWFLPWSSMQHHLDRLGPPGKTRFESLTHLASLLPQCATSGTALTPREVGATSETGPS